MFLTSSLIWIVLLCLAVGGGVFGLVYRKDRRRAYPVKWLPSLLRGLLVSSVLFLLLAPDLDFHLQKEEQPVVLWLQDNSTSIARALGKNAAAYRAAAEDGIGTLKEKADVRVLGFGTYLTTDSIFRPFQTGTNIEQALEDAVNTYKDQNIGAVILSTDGIYNQGMAPGTSSFGQKIPVYTVGLGDSVMPVDEAVVRYYANRTIALNSISDISADIAVTRLKGREVKVNLVSRGSILASAVLHPQTDNAILPVKFSFKASHPGLQKLSIVAVPAAGEPNVVNNKQDFYVQVMADDARILLWFNAPHPDMQAIKEALKGTGVYKFTEHFGSQPPAGLQDYALIIAHNIPSRGGNSNTLARLPVWYIAGERSDAGNLNQAQALVQTGNGPLTHFAVANGHFSLFTLMSQTENVISRMPPLSGAVSVINSNAGGQVLLSEKNSGRPLWVMAPAPESKSVLAGEGLWRWRLYEYKNTGNHQVVDELIKQTVGLLLRKKDNAPFQVYLEKNIWPEGEQIDFTGELRNAAGAMVNGPDAHIVIKGNHIKTPVTRAFEKEGDGYHLNAGILPAGDYEYTGTVVYEGKSYSSAGTFVVAPLNPEDMRTYSDFNVLKDLSRQTGGRFFTAAQIPDLVKSVMNDPNVKPRIHMDNTPRPFISFKWLFAVILLLASAEWVIRKYWG